MKNINKILLKYTFKTLRKHSIYLLDIKTQISRN